MNLQKDVDENVTGNVTKMAGNGGKWREDESAETSGRKCDRKWREDESAETSGRKFDRK
jgi:hypothetical protein